jgi:hypothetical protein
MGEKAPSILIWIVKYLITCVIYTLLMVVAVFVASGIEGRLLFEEAMPIIFVYVYVCNFFITIIGALKGKYIYIIASFSLAAGSMIGILNACTDSAGWEYFAAVMLLILILGFGVVLGGIVQLIYFIRKKKLVKKNVEPNLMNNDEIIKKGSFGKIGLILLGIYGVLLLALVIATLFYLEYEEVDHYLEPLVEVEEMTYGQQVEYHLESISYIEQTAEYKNQLEINKDGATVYNRYESDEDRNETLLSSTEKVLTEKQVEELEDYLIHESGF